MNHATRIAALLGASAIAAALIVTNASTAGPLNPPAGPVVDTGPSLAELEQRLQGIEFGLASLGVSGSFADFTSKLFVNSQLPFASPVVAFPESIFLRSVLLDTGYVEIIDGADRVVARVAAGSTDANGSNYLGGMQYDIGLLVEGPVKLRRISNIGTNPTLIYAEVPSP